jgi:autonomous glycyl radical cofactor GrcA
MERSGTLKLKKFLSKLQTNLIDERAKKTTELLLMNYMNGKLRQEEVALQLRERMRGGGHVEVRFLTTGARERGFSKWQRWPQVSISFLRYYINPFLLRTQFLHHLTN